MTRLGSWVLGHDVLAGGEISEVVDRATEIIFPQGVGAGERAQNRLRDADIVEAHRRSGADVLVTRDGAVLRAAPVLLRELGVRIVSPPDACRLIRGEQ